MIPQLPRSRAPTTDRPPRPPGAPRRRNKTRTKKKNKGEIGEYMSGEGRGRGEPAACPGCARRAPVRGVPVEGPPVARCRPMSILAGVRAQAQGRVARPRWAAEDQLVRGEPAGADRVRRPLAVLQPPGAAGLEQRIGSPRAGRLPRLDPGRPAFGQLGRRGADCVGQVGSRWSGRSRRSPRGRAEASPMSFSDRWGGVHSGEVRGRRKHGAGPQGSVGEQPCHAWQPASFPPAARKRCTWQGGGRCRGSRARAAPSGQVRIGPVTAAGPSAAAAPTRAAGGGSRRPLAGPSQAATSPRNRACWRTAGRYPVLSRAAGQVAGVQGKLWIGYRRSRAGIDQRRGYPSAFGSGRNGRSARPVVQGSGTHDGGEPGQGTTPARPAGSR